MASHGPKSPWLWGGYIEISTVAMALPWQAMGQSRHGYGGDIQKSPQRPWPCHGKPWAKVAMAIDLEGVGYIEISTVAMALPWQAIG